MASPPADAANGPLPPNDKSPTAPATAVRDLGLPNFGGFDDAAPAHRLSAAPGTINIGRPTSNIWTVSRWGSSAAAMPTVDVIHHLQDNLRSIADWPMLFHVVVAMALTWLLGWLQVNVLLAVSWMVFFLHQIYLAQRSRQQSQIRAELRKEILIEQPVSDEETTRWLNAAMAKAWPVWLERVVSLKMVPMLAPWFLNTYKPGVLQKLELKATNMGSNAPVVTSARVYNAASDGNHLEMEVNMEIVSAPDMFMQFTAHVGSAKWAGLGLIPWTAFATDLHLFGRTRIGVRFGRSFPFIDRISISFVGEPQVALAIKVMGMGLGKGFDAGGLPLVASYVDATLKRALKGSLVAPNKLVIEDIILMLKTVVEERKPDPGAVQPDAALAHPSTKTGDSNAPKEHPLGFAHVEVLEAEQLIASDANGLSDPYVKGSLGTAKFNSSIKRATLNPKWFEEFHVPILAWTEHSILRLQVKDYDRFTADDDLGLCEIDMGQLRDGRRHDLWIRLDGAKSGKLHVAVTIHEEEEGDKVESDVRSGETADGQEAVLHTQTISKDGDNVAMASATLKPKDDFPQRTPQTEPAPPLDGANKKDSGLRLRSVHIGNSAYQVAPGCVVYAWDK